MNRKHGIVYGEIKDGLEEILAHVDQLEREREEALKQVERWNEKDEIRKAKDESDEAILRANMGFAPAKEVWDEINAWEDRHASEKHPIPELKEPRKYIPRLARFRYEFENTHLGQVGTVVCVTCAEKALKKSLGNLKTYHELCKKYDAEYFVELD